MTERRIPELITVLGSQPGGDVSHKPGGRLPLLSADATGACAVDRRRRTTAAGRRRRPPPLGNGPVVLV